MSSEVERLPRTLQLSSSPIRDTNVAGESYLSTLQVVLVYMCVKDGQSSLQYVLLPTQDPSHAEGSFTDGSDVLFSLYNEKAAEYDQKLAENWREDAQGVMILVRNAITHLCPVNTHQTSLEWSHISHSGNIPFTIVPDLSNDLSRRRCLLSRPDISTTGQLQFKQL
jgi:hypothetical protein